MEYSPSLVDGLALLRDAVDDPTADLHAVLTVLTDNLTAAVPAFLGLTITLHVEDNPVVITSLAADNTADVRSSLLLQLLPRKLGRASAEASVTFYSATSGAFIDLADDARWIFDLAGPSVLDGHLPPPAGDPVAVRGLATLSEFNQAVGVLFEEGHTQRNAALGELRRRAHQHGQTVQEAARHLLRNLRGYRS